MDVAVYNQRTDPDDDALLDRIQREAAAYVLNEFSADNGLVMDRTQPDAPCSIAAVGLTLSSYPVVAERGWLPRPEAARRAATTLRFFERSPQGPEPDAAGYHGFYYHFLDMKTGRRAPRSELSTIDTALLLAGALTAAGYFGGDTADERDIRRIAEVLYARVEWPWAQTRGAAISHGWRPRRGFLPYDWTGYNEALIVYALALGSPTHPVHADAYAAWTSTYKWKRIYGHEYLYAGPLFIHQLTHAWVDFRDLQDEYMRRRHSDYFENSRRATLVHQQYGVRNPRGWEGYGATTWGITASDGPGPGVRTVRDRSRRFYGYRARGVPFGPDDGTLAPWAVASSLPFAPEIVLPTLRHFDQLELRSGKRYGFRATFNSTYPSGGEHPAGWVSPWYFGLNQGPVILMIENFRSGLIWRLIRDSPHIARGLRRAGFTGGWL
ncbi:MAG: hypothetical protein H0W67_10105 [Gemmatimonadales bacterium]|nr:hypothetical protein [Gemmatimonadales bacterium]